MKTINSILTHRHSRVGGNLGKVRAPESALKLYLCKFYPDWIPAYAGMTEVGCE